MKDEKGLFYWPFPQNKKVRMYVREQDGNLWFRLWNADDPQLWDDHGWVPYGAVKKAGEMYRGQGFDPQQAYDLSLATALIEENRGAVKT
jgi:hypothetical protein